MRRKQRDPTDYEQLARELNERDDPAAQEYLETLEKLRTAPRTPANRPARRLLVHQLRTLRLRVRAAYIAQNDTQLRFIAVVTARSLREALNAHDEYFGVDDGAVTISANRRGVMFDMTRPLELVWRYGSGHAAVRQEDLRTLLAQAERELPEPLGSFRAMTGAIVMMRFNLDTWFGTGDLCEQMFKPTSFGTEFGYAGT